MADFGDFGELYADLEDPDIDIVRAVEEEEGDTNELDENGAGYENGTVESCSSSDSEDDLQILLNEESSSNKPSFQLITAGRDCEDEGDDDLVIVTGTGCYSKELNMAELGQSADGLLRVNKDRGNSMRGAHRDSGIFCSPGSAPRSWSSLSAKDHWDHLAVPCSLGNASYNLGFPIAFPNGYDFYLPRNRSIFDIDVESFDCKPWRFNGVDVTDYFNFGLDEEGWRTYCKQLPTCTMSGEVAQHVRDNDPEILNYLHNERKGIRMPKGRAIQVESGNGDRIPSIDVRRPRNQDLDVVIQIMTGPVAEDALDPTNDRTTHVDETVSKSERFSNTNNNFRKSSKSSDRNGSFEASRDDAFLVKVPSPECDHLSSDSWSQETVFSDCYDSKEAGSDISKIDRTICGGDASESFLDLNYSERATNHGIVKLNLGSDDELASPPLHRKKEDDKYQRKDSDTVFRKPDDELNERDHSSQRGKIPRRNKNKENKGKESKATSFLACLGGHGEDSSPVLNREKRSSVINSEFKTKRNDFYVRSTSRKFKTRINDCYGSRKSQHNRRIQIEIVNRNYLNSNSRDMSLYCRRGYCTSRRVDEHDTMKEADCTMKAKSSCREKSSNENRESSFSEYRERYLNEYSERSLDDLRERDLAEYSEFPCIYEEEERSTDKCDRVPCSSGALRRCHELFSYEKNQFLDFELSSRYANEEGSWLCDDSHRNRIPSLFKLNKRYMSHSEYSHPQESFPTTSNKHLVSRKTFHKYLCKTDFNLYHDQSAEGRAAYVNTAYNEGSLPLPGILPKREVNLSFKILTCPLLIDTPFMVTNIIIMAKLIEYHSTARTFMENISETMIELSLM